MDRQYINVLRKLLAAIFRKFLPAKPPSLEFTAQHWDKEYDQQQWDYLANISELGRYSVITGYISHINSNASILEIGCGTGLLFNRLKHLPYKFYTGIDISEKAIQCASRNSDEKTTFIAANGANFSDEKVYDIIVFNEALYYFDDCISVLRHYKKMLKADGHFIVSMVVGDTSNLHWKKIEQNFKVIDAVKITNAHGITWNCRVLSL